MFREEVICISTKQEMGYKNVPVNKTKRQDVYDSSGAYAGSNEQNYTEWHHIVQVRETLICPKCGNVAGELEYEVDKTSSQ
jgi:N-acetyl-gamma-glutamylphosphate reductase